MSEMKVIPIQGKCFGARVENVNVRSLDEKELESIKAAFLKFGFLLFPGQYLNDEENIRFGELFGSLEFGGLPIANQYKNEDGTYGEIIELDSQRMRTNVGNEAWHTDSTYWPISRKCAKLSAVVVPDEGGETELADMRAGYRELDSLMKEKIENLSAYHSTQYSQANDLGDFPEQAQGGIYHGEAYLRPIVKIHPETGVKN